MQVTLTKEQLDAISARYRELSAGGYSIAQAAADVLFAPYELAFELSIDAARLLDPSKGPFMAPEIRERILLDELSRARRVLILKPEPQGILYEPTGNGYREIWRGPRSEMLGQALHELDMAQRKVVELGAQLGRIKEVESDLADARSYVEHWQGKHAELETKLAAQPRVHHCEVTSFYTDCGHDTRVHKLDTHESWDPVTCFRCVRTALYAKIAAPESDPLSDELRADAEWAIEYHGSDSRSGKACAELLRRCPKPEPTRPTVAELKHRVFTAENIRTSKVALESFEEIVRLAEKTERLEGGGNG